MKRNMLRYLALLAIALLLAALLATSCTRSKSSGPSEATAETSATEAPETPGAEPSATSDMSGQEGLDATRTAWANETATAEAPTPGGETGEPEDTPAATEPPEATAPGATEEPEATAPGATEEPEATSAPEPTSEPEPTQPPTSTEERIHVVKPGENLFRISLSYGLPYQTVMAYNGIANPNMIYVGQEIKIPPSSGGTAPQPQPTSPPPTGGTRTHIVKPGENLFRVALQYNLSYTVVAEANNLSYPYTIYTGQKLIIP
jgi:LysM repeat protein